MIILDTNVLSALMQRVPESAVIDWLDAQAPDNVWISSITLYEARYGLALLDDGKRKELLQQQLNTLVRDDLDNRVAVFDVRAAKKAAELAAERKRRGRPVDIRDTFIGGIAIANGAALATRNTRHFEDLPTPVVNPWDFDR
ncbi:MAG: type II toxin-antitoxin system VapC family toxin [Wenzhouxiangellaceae bacterium]